MPMDTEVVTPQPSRPVDYDNILLMRDMARLFKTSQASIRRRIADGTFPITPLPGGIDTKFRWWGPTVRAWLERNGGRQ